MFIVFIEVLALIGLICCLIWAIYGFMEDLLGHVFMAILFGGACCFLFFSNKTNGVEFEVFEDRMNVYSAGSINEPFKLDFKVKVVENEDGDVYIPTGEDPRLAFYVDSADGSCREKVTMFADAITIKSLESNEHPHLTLTYKYVKKGNFWYNTSMKPYDGKVWWTLYLPDNAIVKEQ